MSKTLRKAIILPDIHAPYHHRTALKMVKKILEKVRPSHLVSVGDFVDAYSVSRFHKSANRKVDLQAEVDSAIEVAAKLKDWAPGAKCVVTLGNHDVRIDIALEGDHKNLGTPSSLNFPQRLWELGWTVVPYKESFLLGQHLSVTHDIGRSGKNAVSTAIADYGDSLVFGHTHRAAVWYEGSINGPDKVAMNVGWLGDPRYIDYKHKDIAKRSYILGVGMVDFHSNGLFKAQFIPFVEWRGKMYACIYGEWLSVKGD